MYTDDEIRKIEQADAEFITALKRDLARRGYTDIEILGGGAFTGCGWAMATKDGQRYQLKAIVPSNCTTYRRPHFRVTVVN